MSLARKNKYIRFTNPYGACGHVIIQVENIKFPLLDRAIRQGKSVDYANLGNVLESSFGKYPSQNVKKKAAELGIKI